MSLFVSMHVDCPECDHTNTMDAVGSVNADRRPDLREEILEDQFQIIKCANCDTEFRLQPEFNYLDVENGLWILAMPADGVADYIENEDKTTALFGTSYGADAPDAAQTVGDNLTCRLTFGWLAAREKLVLRIAGLDDIIVEMMKMDLLRRMPGAHFDIGVELRVTSVSDENLELAWVRAVSEEALEFMAVSKEAYFSVENARDQWGGIEAQLTDGPFVDIQKLFLGSGRNQDAAE